MAWHKGGVAAERAAKINTTAQAPSSAKDRQEEEKD
jgi:hypothetical protein